MSSYIGPKPSDQVVGSAGFSNINVGANVVLSTTGLTVGALGTVFVGNSSVNCVANTSAVYLNGNAITAHQGMRNRLINGDFKIFQRNAAATTVTLNGVGYTGPDRFFVYQNGTAQVQTTQVSSGLTGFQYALRWGRPSTSTSTGVTVLGQAMETVNCYDLQGQTVTLSFWARAGSNFSSVSNALYVALYAGTGTDQSAANMTTGSWTSSSTPISTTINLSTTWTRYTFTVTLGSSISQLGFYSNWTPSGTAGNDDYVYITGVQLEKGSVATPFETRLYGTELALCQRYFQIYYQPMLRGVATAGAGAGRMGMTLPVVMRASPIAVVGALPVYDGTATTTVSSVGVAYLATDHVEFDFALAASLTANRPCMVYTSGSTTMTLSAEL